MLPKVVSLIAIVVLLGWMFYFLCGGLPLLFLKHDVALDGRFVHRFFHVHYLGLATIAAIGSVSSALSGCGIIPAAIGGIAVFGFAARHLIVARMDTLLGVMTATNAPAILSFRRLHLTGLLLNVALLVGFIAFLGYASSRLQSCVEMPAW